MMEDKKGVKVSMREGDNNKRQGRSETLLYEDFMKVRSDDRLMTD